MDNPPVHLVRGTAAETFRYIAAWAENAAECFEEVDREYDPGSERAQELRKIAITCSAHIFFAIAEGNPEAKWRLARGLDEAQRTALSLKPFGEKASD